MFQIPLLNKISLSLIGGICLFTAGFFTVKHVEYNSNELQIQKAKLVSQSNLINHLESTITFKNNIININESTNNDLLIKLNSIQGKYKDVSNLIQSNKKWINMHNTLSPEWMCIMERASTGNTDMSSTSGNACAAPTTDRIIPDASGVLLWTTGLIAHDKSCVVIANARLEWYNAIKSNYNKNVITK